MKKITCFLIRHGKTRGNLEKRYVGCQTDEGLCPEGRREIAELYKDTDYKVGNCLYISPMKRCLETAELIWPDLKYISEEGFKEIDFGEFENKNYMELSGNSAYQAWIDSNGSLPFPGGESRKSFIERNLKAFKDILINKIDESADTSVPFVIHGGSIMAIMSSLTGKDYYDFQISCGQGYIVNLEVGDNNIDLISYDSLFDRSNS